MKSAIANLVEQALKDLPEIAAAADEQSLQVTVERARDTRYGDFASNVAMQLAKRVGRKPRDLAESIIASLPASELIDKTEVAGPGFINFYLSDGAFHQELGAVLAQGNQYGRKAPQESPRVLLEFVSANPTGPLHVGHGRHAAYGATIGNLLASQGLAVEREYYVNDAGRQMDILGVSVWLRMLEATGIKVPFPEAGYRGDYIRDIAASIDSASFTAVSGENVVAGLPEDAPTGDKEDYIGALIDRAQELLGTKDFFRLRRASLESIRDEIRDDLQEFGVTFDRWFSEQSLHDDGQIDEALSVLRERGMLYEQDGATWFRATDFGDEKDRVVIRENGKKTYFASDIAYHYGKRQRGFDFLLDVLGADHHGYLARVRAGLDAMGYSGESLEVQLVQFVTLFRAGKKQQMGTRSGKFITLRQLREEIGNDAARFFYVMRSNDQHLEFDLELAKSRSQDNPVYYMQYAHARICSVFRKLGEKGYEWDSQLGNDSLPRLSENHERALMSSVSRYPEVLELAATNRAPQNLVHYLRDLANDFHTFYNAHIVMVNEAELRNARLTLCAAVRTIIANGLGILGVSAPESM
ncbi:MAG: arginine--tRNA ligase [Gammaproteobacteria bacterium]|nr:arginine--tRNA ligase [Gammaproteobacteria bacterium]